jgi:hypothetical protein
VKKAGWSEAAARSLALAASRPVLPLVPAGAVAAARLVAAVPATRLWTGFGVFAVFSAANAVFARVWRAADMDSDGGRFPRTAAVFLIPAPLFFAASVLTSLAVYDNSGGRMTAAWLQLYGMKALAAAVTIWAAVSIPSLETGSVGAFGALRRGASVFARNLGPALAAVISILFFERLVGFLWREWRASFSGSASASVARFARDWSLSAATMFFGVALPLRADAAGLLEDA